MNPSEPSREVSGQDRFDVVLEFLRSDRTLSDFAREQGLAEDQLEAWVRRLETAGPGLFEDAPSASFDDATLDGFIESIPEMLLVIGDDRTISHVNSTLLDLLGYTEDELIGESCGIIMEDGTVEEDELDHLLEAKGSKRKDVKFRTRSGETIPVVLSISTMLQAVGTDEVLCFARDISELRETQERLRQEKNRFQAIYDEAPVGLWEEDMSGARAYIEDLKNEGVEDLGSYLEQNPDELREVAGRIKTLSVNQQLLDILGARDRDHLLQNLNNIFTDETYEVFRDQMVQFFEKGKTTYRNEVEVQTVDGEPRTVLFSLNVPATQKEDWSWVFVTYRDITERKRIQRELEKNEERFRQLAENINSVFWIEDLESGENLYISPAVEEINGRSRKEFIKNPDAFLDMVHPEDRDRVEEAFRSAREEKFVPPERYEEEYRILRPDGEVRWLHDRAYPVRNDEGEVYRVAGIAEDITNRKRMEQTIQDSLQEKETLLQEVHHRVKNNMQIISSLLRLQSYQISDEETRRHFLDCQQRVHSMVLVHEQLYQSDKLSDVNVEEYLRELMESLIDSYATGIEPEVEFDIDDDLNLVLDDTIACGLIVNEIISNSIEHGFDGTREDARIRLEFHQSDGTVRLRVRDNGVGLPEDFDPDTADSLGVQLIDSITSTQLDGTYEIHEDNGTVVEVVFTPKSGGSQENGP